MPINSTQLYVRDLLDNLALPLDMGTLAAYITPPPSGDAAGQPAAYVWGSRGAESRRAIPRAQHGNLASGAWKTLTHDLDIWIVWAGSFEDPNVDQCFPVVIDAVLAALRNAQLLDQQNVITDPATEQVSNLLNLGEQMQWEYAPVRALADQRMYRYDAQITVSCEEWLQA